MKMHDETDHDQFIIHEKCCLMQERSNIIINKVKNFGLLVMSKIYIICETPKQVEAISKWQESIPFKSWPDAKGNAESLFPWRLSKVISNTILISNNEVTTKDLESTISIPISLQDTIHDSYLTMIAMNSESLNENKINMLRNLIENGIFGKCGNKHNIIMPLFIMKSESINGTWLPFSAVLTPNGIFLGEAAWKLLWQVENGLITQIMELDQNMIIYLNSKMQSRPIKLNILGICVMVNKLLLTFSYSELQLKNLSFNYSNLLLKQFLLHLCTISMIILNPSIHQGILAFYCDKYFSFENSNVNINTKNADEFINSSILLAEEVFIIFKDQIIGSTNINFIKYQLWRSFLKIFLLDCEFDISSSESTVYSMNPNTRSLKLVTIPTKNLMSYENEYSSNHIPVHLTLLLPIINSFVIHSNQEIIEIQQEFLVVIIRLTVNNILYGGKNNSLPVIPIRIYESRDKQTEFTLEWFLVIGAGIQYFSNKNGKESDSINILKYICEIMYQLIGPLIICKIPDNHLQVPKKESYFKFLKISTVLLRCRLPTPLEFQNRAQATSEFIISLWPTIPSVDELVSLFECMFKIVFPVVPNGFGALKFNKLIQQTSSCNIYPSPLNWHNDPVRNALHLQLPLSILIQDALLQHFPDLQRLAWKCHPLYSPNVEPPPHCRVSLSQNEFYRERFHSTESVLLKDCTQFPILANANIIDALDLFSQQPVSTIDVVPANTDPLGLVWSFASSQPHARGARSDETSSDAVSGLPEWVGQPDLHDPSITQTPKSESTGQPTTRNTLATFPLEMTNAEEYAINQDEISGIDLSRNET